MLLLLLFVCLFEAENIRNSFEEIVISYNNINFLLNCTFLPRRHAVSSLMTLVTFIVINPRKAVT